MSLLRTEQVQMKGERAVNHRRLLKIQKLSNDRAIGLGMHQ